MRLLRFAIACAIAAALAPVLGCMLPSDDKCYVNDVRYREARRAFERTQSVELVRQALLDASWPDCQIRECIYRIEKEFGLKDQLPSPVKVRGEAELAAEEAQDSAQGKLSLDVLPFSGAGGSSGSKK